MAPGRPPLAHQGVGYVAQPHGADGSFEIDPVQLGLARGGGKPLPQPVLAKMEAAFGADFSAVRVHVGPQAPRIGAVAFTTGNDLYFAPGRYQPDSLQGQQLLGHELAHVVQQRQGRVRAQALGIAVVQDWTLEAEADRLGARAAAHRNIAQAKSCAGPPGTVVSPRPLPTQLRPINSTASMRGIDQGANAMLQRSRATRSQTLNDLQVSPELSARNIRNGPRVRKGVNRYGIGDNLFYGVGPYGLTAVDTTDVRRVFSDKEKKAVNLNGAANGCHTCGEKISGHADEHFTPDHQPPLSVFAHEHGSLAGYKGKLYPHCKSCSCNQGGLLSGAKAAGCSIM
jgi:hypothetical protein